MHCHQKSSKRRSMPQVGVSDSAYEQTISNCSWASDATIQNPKQSHLDLPYLGSKATHASASR
jgi:hypothetical protein